MEFITSFASNYYIPLLIVGVIMLFALIGFISTQIKDRGMTKFGNDISMSETNNHPQNNNNDSSGANLSTTEDK